MPSPSQPRDDQPSCPVLLLYYAKPSAGLCLKKLCAWWIVEKERCAVPQVARALTALAGFTASRASVDQIARAVTRLAHPLHAVPRSSSAPSEIAVELSGDPPQSAADSQSAAATTTVGRDPAIARCHAPTGPSPVVPQKPDDRPVSIAASQDAAVPASDASHEAPLPGNAGVRCHENLPAGEDERPPYTGQAGGIGLDSAKPREEPPCSPD